MAKMTRNVIARIPILRHTLILFQARSGDPTDHPRALARPLTLSRRRASPAPADTGVPLKCSNTPSPAPQPSRTRHHHNNNTQDHNTKLGDVLGDPRKLMAGIRDVTREAFSAVVGDIAKTVKCACARARPPP